MLKKYLLFNRLFILLQSNATYCREEDSPTPFDFIPTERLDLKSFTKFPKLR